MGAGITCAQLLRRLMTAGLLMQAASSGATAQINGVNG